MQDNLENRPDLIGYRLGLLDSTERAAVEADCADPTLRERMCQRVDRVLRPLACNTLDPLPSDFVERIVARIEAGETLPFRRAALAAPAGQPIIAGRGSLFSMRELTSLAAALLMFAGILVPGFYSARQAGQKIACSENLRQIGNGFVSYSESYDNQMPFAGPITAGARWAPVSPRADENVMRNSRHVYRLVGGRLIAPEAALCAGATSDRPMRVDRPEDYNDFRDPRNVSFSTNLMTRPWNRDAFVSDMPLAGCRTPLVDDDRRLLPFNAAPGNSGNHGPAAGQNVLRANMSVRFFTSPMCGPRQDDIYRVRGISQYDGTERPKQPDDALLVP